jgi:hypothetical protein
MKFSTSISLACLGLGLFASSVAHASCMVEGNKTPFSSPGILDLKLAPEHEPRADSMSAGFAAGPDAIRFLRFPNAFGADREIATAALQGRLRDHLGSLSMDFKFIWTWRDVIEVNDGPKRYVLSRKELAAYPSLLQRFQSTRPTFDRIELTLKAIPSNPTLFMEQDTITLTLPHGHLVIGGDGEVPPSSPSIPPQWRDRMTMSAPGTQRERPEADMARRWAEYGTARCPFVKIVGLKVPRAELLGIAKLLEEYKAKDKSLEQEFALLKDGLGKTPVAPYTRSDEGARPVEPPAFSAEIVKGLKQGVALSSRGRTVWQSSEHHGISPLDPGGRYFVVWRQRMRQIVNARGVVQSVDGVSRFNGVDKDANTGQYRLSVYDAGGSPAYETRKHYTSGAGVMNDSEFSRFRSRDGDGNCRKSNTKPGELSFHLGSREYYYKGKQYWVDERMRLLRREDAWFRDGSPRSQVGERICDG